MTTDQAVELFLTLMTCGLGLGLLWAIVTRD